MALLAFSHAVVTGHPAGYLLTIGIMLWMVMTMVWSLL